MKSFSLMPYKGNTLALISKTNGNTTQAKMYITQVDNTKKGHCKVVINLDLNSCTISQYLQGQSLFHNYMYHSYIQRDFYCVEFPLWMRNRSKDFYRKIFTFKTNY